MRRLQRNRVATVAAVSSPATAPRRDALDRPVTIPSEPKPLPADLLAGAGVAIALAAIAFVTTGGSELAPNTWTEIALVLSAVAAAVAAIVWLRRGPLPGVASLALFAGVAALTALSVAWSVAPDLSWVEAGRTLSYFAVFAIGLLGARLAPGRWPALIGGVAVATVAVVGYALLTKVFPGSLDAGDPLGRLNTPFTYWNATGLIGALGLPPCLWAGSQQRGSAPLRALSAPAISILIAAVVLSYSRSAVVAAVLAVALWLWLAPDRLRAVPMLALGGAGGAAISLWALQHAAFKRDGVALATRTSTGHSFGLVLVLVLIVLTLAGFAVTTALQRGTLSASARRRVSAGLLTLVALMPVAGIAGLAASHRGLTGQISHIWNQLTSTRATVGDSPGRLTSVANTRPLYWGEGITVGKHNLLAGAGADGFQVAHVRYAHNPQVVEHAHSYVFQTFADFGLLGLAVNLALLLAWGRAAAAAVGPRAGSDVRAQPPERTGLITLLCVVVAFGVNSSVDWTWFVPGVTIPAMLCAGWLAGRRPWTGPDPERLPERRALTRSPVAAGVATGLVIAGLAAAWLTWQPLRSANADSAGIAAAARGDLPAAIADERRAISRDPLALSPRLDLAKIEAAAGLTASARGELLSAVDEQPSNPAGWQALGEFELHHGQARQAIGDLLRAQRLDRLTVQISTDLILAEQEAAKR
jgi:O-Antigen ligase